VWKPFRDKWQSLPTHIRKGLLRLYTAVSSLWLLWFGYQLVVVINNHSYGPIWRYISELFWTLWLVPIGGPILLFMVIWIVEGFRKPQFNIGNLRERVATDILFRPDIAAFEYLATGSLFGKKEQRFRLDENRLSTEHKAVLPNEFYGANGVDPDEFAKLFGYQSGDALIDSLSRLFVKWGYLDRDQMLNKVVDEEVDRRRRKVSAIRK